MKKLLLTTILLATVFIVLGGMNAFQKLERISFASKANHKIQVDTIYSVKYDDCIKQSDFPDIYAIHSQQMSNKSVDWDVIKVNESVKKYGESLNATIKNLNTVDAHDFIHQAFKKSKAALTGEDISEIQKHYHFEIMRICYDSDKYLNQSTVGRL